MVEIVQTVPTTPADQTRKKVIFRTYQIIWYILGVIETLLAFRFIFKLLGANPGSPFVQLVYSASNGLIAPFRGIFPTPVIEGSVFEWTTIVATAVYAVIAYGIVYLFQIVKPVKPQEVNEKVDNP